MEFFQVIFAVVFCLVLLMFFYGFYSVIGKELKRKKQNSAAPTLSVNAKIITKRLMVRGEHSHTFYYATFEVESGDRIELSVPSEQYGYLAEHDVGMLTFKGDMFLSFTQHRDR